MTETKPTDSKRNLTEKHTRQTTLIDFGFPLIQTCLNLFQNLDKNHQVPSQTTSPEIFKHVIKSKDETD